MISVEKYYKVAQNERATENEILAAIAEVTAMGDGYAPDEHRGGGHSEGVSWNLSLRDALSYRLGEIRLAARKAEIRAMLPEVLPSPFVYTHKAYARFENGASRSAWITQDTCEAFILDVIRYGSSVISIIVEPCQED